MNTQANGRSRYVLGLPPVELWGVATKDATHTMAWSAKAKRLVLVPIARPRVAA